jgi:hypothetical protein
MTRLKSALGIVALTALVASPNVVMGEETPIIVGKATIKTEMEGMTVTLVRPSWSTGSELASEVYRNSPQKSVEVIEFIPKGETFESWTHMSAALLVAQPGYSANAMLDSVAQAFDGGCKKESLQYGTVRPAKNGHLVVLAVACGEYIPGAGGGDAGMGEVMLFEVVENQLGVMKAYEEWRGKAFDPNDLEAWPVSHDEFQRQADAMQANAGFVKK